MRRLLLLVLMTLFCMADSQTVDFEQKTYPDSPVVFVAEATRSVAPGVPKRQFITIKSESKKAISAVILQQTVSNGSKVEIIAIERVSQVMLGGEKKRVSIAVADMLAKLQSAASSERPVLTIVAVEFVDGTLWDAPTVGQAILPAAAFPAAIRG